jgi:putative phosphoesterase
MTPMRLAVFSDIHSNILALNEVLNDIEKQGCDGVYCLGDLVGYGPRPNEVIETIHGLGIPTVMGNYDDGVGYERGDCGCAYTTDEEKQNGQRSIEWTTQQVTRENKNHLRSLHEKIELQIEEKKVLLVHGSPRRINEYLYEDRPEESLRRMLSTVDADILVCGHTHKPYHREVNGVHIINDGSVGKPKDGDNRACYAIINLDKDVKVEFRRLPYQIETVAEEIIKNDLPSAFAEALRSGK